jgi:hypothetical protein
MEMQATQTRSQGRQSINRAAVAIAILVAAALITLGTLYVTRGRTASPAPTKAAHVQVAGTGSGPSVDTVDESTSGGYNAHAGSGYSAAGLGLSGGASSEQSIERQVRNLRDLNRAGGSAAAALAGPQVAQPHGPWLNAR